MRISDKRAEELRRLYKEAYGKDISVEEARDMGRRLVALYQLLMRPFPSAGEQQSSQEPPAQTPP